MYFQSNVLLYCKPKLTNFLVRNNSLCFEILSINYFILFLCFQLAKAGANVILSDSLKHGAPNVLENALENWYDISFSIFIHLESLFRMQILILKNYFFNSIFWHFHVKKNISITSPQCNMQHTPFGYFRHLVL